MPLTLWQKAASFAARAHGSQLRKDDRTPYYSHPVRVAMTVCLLFECTDDTTLAASILHDVIEDTTIDYDDLLTDFNREVADIVACLSKDPRMIEPERETAYDKQLERGPWQAKLIKLADVFDNLTDAADAAAVDRMIGRAQRAMNIARDEPRCQGAIEVVRQLVENVQSTKA